MKIEPIHPDPTQADKLPYSPSIRVQGGADILFVSGSTALPLYHSHPHIHAEHVIPDDIRIQTRRAMDDIKLDVVHSATSLYSNVIRDDVFRMNMWVRVIKWERC